MTSSAGEREPDYRESHVGTGQDYHDKFLRGPYRSVIWELEQECLLGILDRHRAGRTSGLRMLDFACGTGRVLQLFESHVDSAMGVDVSESMLDVAKSHLSRSELLRADITREPVLADRHFDLITAFRFFPNAEPQLRDEVMRELAGRLSEDGILILNNHLRCVGSKLRLRRLLLRLFGRGRGKVFHCMSDEEVTTLAERFGLAIAEEHSLAMLPVLKEKRPGLPRAILCWLEHAALRWPALRRFANLRIYVLEPAGRGHVDPEKHSQA
jgi:SAM-dependent methyltransferase